jgi:flagellar hook-length control protein FliK
MDAISSSNAMVVEQKQMGADFLSSNFKSLNALGNSILMGKECGSGNNDSSSFHHCLQETVEEMSTRENEISPDRELKIQRKDFPEEEAFLDSAQAAENAVCVNLEYREAEVFQHSFHFNQTYGESETQDDRSDSQRVLSEEALPVLRVSYEVGLAANQDVIESYSAGDGDSDGLLFRDTLASQRAIILPESVPTRWEDGQNEKSNIAGTLTRTELRSTDSGMSNLPPSSEPDKSVSATFAETHAFTFNDPQKTEPPSPDSLPQGAQPYRGNGQTLQRELGNDENEKPTITGSLTKTDQRSANSGRRNLAPSSELEKSLSATLADTRAFTFDDPPQPENRLPVSLPQGVQPYRENGPTLQRDWGYGEINISSEKTIFTKGKCGEVEPLRNTNTPIPNYIESEIMDDRNRLQGLSLEEALPAMTVRYKNSMADHSGMIGSYSVEEEKSDGPVSWKTCSFQKGNLLSQSVPTGITTGENKKTDITGSLAKTELTNADSGMESLTPAGKLEEPRNVALAKTPADTINNPSQAENHSLPPYNWKLHEKKEAPTSGFLGNNTKSNFMDSEPGQTETAQDKLLSRPSVQRGKSTDIQVARLNQEVNSLLGNAPSEQLKTGRTFSVDAGTFKENSGESRSLDPQGLVKSIIDEGTSVISKGGGRVKMTLNPPNLGSLDMEIRVRNNTVELVFVADTPEIQQSLQASTDLLKAALNQQGFKIDGYNVLLQGSMDANSGYFSGESSPWRNARKDSGKEEPRKKEPIQPEMMANLNPGRRHDRIDSYKISLFI